jgi:hypothetical protein
MRSEEETLKSHDPTYISSYSCSCQHHDVPFPPTRYHAGRMIELGEVEVDVEVLICRSGVKILMTGARHKVGVGVEYVRKEGQQ